MCVPGSDASTYLDAARDLYEGRDAGHDFRHIERIVSRLPELSEAIEPPPDARKMFFLAAFHGLVDLFKTDEDLRAEITSRLRGLGWTEMEIPEALNSLQMHLTNPAQIEEKIVHDANYFEVTGVFGVAKAFTVGGAHGQSYEETIEILEDNIRRVQFRTPHGKLVYEPRKSEALQFLKKLRAEL